MASYKFYESQSEKNLQDAFGLFNLIVLFYCFLMMSVDFLQTMNLIIEYSEDYDFDETTLMERTDKTEYLLPILTIISIGVLIVIRRERSFS